MLDNRAPNPHYCAQGAGSVTIVATAGRGGGGGICKAVAAEEHPVGTCAWSTDLEGVEGQARKPWATSKSGRTRLSQVKGTLGLSGSGVRAKY